MYEGIADNVGKRFDTSNYGIQRPLPKGKNKKDWTNEEWIGSKDYDRICRT